jgi:transcription elongation factor GreA
VAASRTSCQPAGVAETTTSITTTIGHSAKFRLILRSPLSVRRGEVGALFDASLSRLAPAIARDHDVDAADRSGRPARPQYPAAMQDEKPEPMTPAQKRLLESELAELEGPRRAEVVRAIATARGFGDLSENFEYHAAKNEQGLLEHRIRTIRDRLDRAVLVETEASASGQVGIGSSVEIEDDRGERMRLEISSVGGISPDSPLGRALLGARAGDEVEVDAPRGSWRARILSIGDGPDT